MSGFVFERPLPPDARWSRLRITCHGCGVLLAEWSTFDGEDTFVEFGAGSSEEYVGYQPTVEERRRVGPAPLGGALDWAVASPRRGDTAHLRCRLACPRCAVDVQLRGEGVDRLDALVHRLWLQGVEVVELDDCRLDGIFRVGGP